MATTSNVLRGMCMVLLAGGLAACGGTDGPAASTPEPAPATTTPATATDEVEVTTEAPPADDELETTAAAPTAADLEDQGQQDAAEAVEQAWAMIDKTGQDPDLEVGELAKVARGQAVAQWVSNLQMAREEGLVQTGDTKVTVTDVETITEGERYEVTACLDWSDVKFNDVKPDRGEDGDRQQITYVVRPDAGGPELFVTDDPMEYEACDT